MLRVTFLKRLLARPTSFLRDVIFVKNHRRVRTRKFDILMKVLGAAELHWEHLTAGAAPGYLTNRTLSRK